MMYWQRRVIVFSTVMRLIAEVEVIIAEVEVGIAEGLWKRDFGEMLA
jgi:hypothetical protein